MKKNDDELNENSMLDEWKLSFLVFIIVAHVILFILISWLAYGSALQRGGENFEHLFLFLVGIPSLFLQFFIMLPSSYRVHRVLTNDKSDFFSKCLLWILIVLPLLTLISFFIGEILTRINHGE